MEKHENIDGKCYAFTFDLDTTLMSEYGVEPSRVYQQTGEALARNGFSKHPEGSVYVTREPLELEVDEVHQMLEAKLSEDVPDFGRFLRSAHLSERPENMTPRLKKDPGPLPGPLPEPEPNPIPLSDAQLMEYEDEFESLMSKSDSERQLSSTASSKPLGAFQSFLEALDAYCDSLLMDWLTEIVREIP